MGEASYSIGALEQIGHAGESLTLPIFGFDLCSCGGLDHGIGHFMIFEVDVEGFCRKFSFTPL